MMWNPPQPPSSSLLPLQYWQGKPCRRASKVVFMLHTHQSLPCPQQTNLKYCAKLGIFSTFQRSFDLQTINFYKRISFTQVYASMQRRSRLSSRSKPPHWSRAALECVRQHLRRPSTILGTIACTVPWAAACLQRLPQRYAAVSPLVTSVRTDSGSPAYICFTGWHAVFGVNGHCYPRTWH